LWASPKAAWLPVKDVMTPILTVFCPAHANDSPKLAAINTAQLV
jgi:hypothetical protein